MSTGCLYSSYSAQAFAYAMLIPTIVPLALAAASVTRNPKTGEWGKEWILVAFGSYLFFFQLVLYIFQISLQMIRYNPFCPDVLTYGFPSLVGFYVAALGTFVIEYSYLWNAVVSSFYWTYLFLVWWLPCLVLVWFQYNTWQEVLLSLGIGVLITTIFVLAVRYYFLEDMPFILNSTPWTWFSCVDTWVQTRQGQARTEEVKACLARINRQQPKLRGPGSLWRSLY